MSSGPSYVVAAAVSVGLFLRFVRLERQGRGATVLVTVFALILVESALYPDPSLVPAGLFHPGGGSLSFRLQDVVIPLALLARVLARGLPRRLELAAMLWWSFLFWLALQTVVGLANGNPASQATFEAKAIEYLALMALAAGVPLREYVEGDGFDRLVRWCAALPLRHRFLRDHRKAGRRPRKSFRNGRIRGFVRPGNR